MVKWLRRLFRKLFFTIVFLLTCSIVFSTLYPLGYRDYINRYSEEYSIDPFLVAAIINVESNYNKEAISPKNARGLMQIGSQTGMWAGRELGIDSYSEDMLFDPEINIRIGAWYLHKLRGEFEGNLDLILAAYNGGSGNVQKWLSDEKYSKDGKTLDKIPFKETEQYLKKVKNNYKIYRGIYSGYMHRSDGVGFRYIEFTNTLKGYLKKISVLLKSRRK